jgi:predicted DCC family thiol-disulfide oxidoreductase YuxK
MKEIGSEKTVVLFDGVCNLCNSAVNFIIKRDKSRRFLFASLQSNYGQKFLTSNHLDTKNYKTLFVVKPDGSALTKSSAALWICKHLSRPWNLLVVLGIVPRFFRDWVYGLVAEKRYDIFGKKAVCMIPTAELKERFLD